MPAGITTLLLTLLAALPVQGRTYVVGPGREFAEVQDVPWERLAAGDSVKIHAREAPYRAKWVICARGTEDRPVVVTGIADAAGALPVIDGRNAVTRSQLDYWNGPRGIIKIGGANVPADTMPAWVTVENLEIRSGRPPYGFSGRDGMADYAQNAAAIYVEKGEHITIRNCVMRDCGNGFFCASGATDVLVEGCWIYDNGIEGRIYEHNSYTEAKGITFQFNRYGPLREGCRGNNLKDRSSGCVIRYNWIEDGNRQLDLVDSDHGHILEDPAYRETFVYGNVLVEGEGEGNRQIVHYGGDSREFHRYRKGTLYFYNNTVVSTREKTTLFRLSSDEEACEAWNNIVYTTAPGDGLEISNGAGRIVLTTNWLKRGWVPTFGTLSGSVAGGGNVTGEWPGFADAARQMFGLVAGSTCVDAGASGPETARHHPVRMSYGPDRQGIVRPLDERIDLGAFEYAAPSDGTREH